MVRHINKKPPRSLLEGFNCGVCLFFPTRPHKNRDAKSQPSLEQLQLFFEVGL